MRGHLPAWQGGRPAPWRRGRRSARRGGARGGSRWSWPSSRPPPSPLPKPAWWSLAVWSPKPRVLSPQCSPRHPSLLSSHLRSREVGEARDVSRIQSDATPRGRDGVPRPTESLRFGFCQPPPACRVPCARLACVAVAVGGALAITYSRDAMNESVMTVVLRVFGRLDPSALRHSRVSERDQ